jgi:hypothetical protein
MDNQQQMYGQAPQYNPNPSPSPQPYQVVNPNIAYAQPQPMYGGQGGGYAPMMNEGGQPVYQQPYQQYPQGQGQQMVMMQQPMQTTQGEPHPQQQQTIMVTSSSSPQQPMMIVAAGNPFYTELIGHRCCCGCCDLRTGVMVLGGFLILSGILSLAETADYGGGISAITWIIMLGDLFCGASGMYGAYHYNWRWTYPLLIWLYLACVIYVILIILMFALASVLCQYCYDDYDDDDNSEDTCFGVCVGIFTYFAVAFIIVLILYIYFTYVVQTFCRLLRQAETKIAIQNQQVNANASSSSQQTTVVSTIR